MQVTIELEIIMKGKSGRVKGKETDLREEFTLDVMTGLSARKKFLPCRYLYDERGSRLFTRIMELPEYYLTGAETDILLLRCSDICSCFIDDTFSLVELGAGDGQKTLILIDELLKKNDCFKYIPIDISEEALLQCRGRISEEFPHLTIRPLADDYFEGLAWLSCQEKNPLFVLFLGSNIGNFSPLEGIAFLRKLKGSLKRGDFLLIGFDLVKDIDTMIAAYNDREGVTEEFNKNILNRINRELGGDFDLSAFTYYSTWDSLEQAVVSSLVSRKGQTVTVESLERTFNFQAWEAIHTESSYKYTCKDIERLADESGFALVETFFDDKNFFADSLWMVE